MSNDVWASGSAAAGSGGLSVGSNDAVTSQARTAAMLGISGMGLMMTACCTSILGIIAGTALGGIAYFQANNLLKDSLQGEALAYANVGKWTGLATLIWGGVVLALILAYIAFYVLIIMFAILSGA